MSQKKNVIVHFSRSKLLEDLVNDASNSLDEICQRLDTHTPGLGDYENIAKHYGYAEGLHSTIQI